MDLIWEQGELFMKDIIDSYPDPKPAATTVATLLKRMQDKGFVGYRLFGNSRQYYSLVARESYCSLHMNELIEDFFDNSSFRFASFFTRRSDMSEAELEDLKRIVEQEIKKKKQ